MEKTHLLSDRVLSMEESATLKMTQTARDLKAKGVDVISLSVGEPDFDTPEFIKKAAFKALEEGYTKYTPVPGLPELRKAIVAKFKRDNDLNYEESQIVVSNGAKQSIANVCLSLLNPGDEVIILAPFWVSYTEIVKLAEGVPVIVYAGIEQDFKPTAEQIEASITDRTKILLFSSPSNPTGAAYSAKELEAIADMMANYPNIHIVSDEIYEYINFSGKNTSIGSFPQVADQTITVNGFSKGFSMTGWRLGYIGAPKEIAAACTKIQGQITSGATSFGQKAAIEALANPNHPDILAMKEAFLNRRELVITLLSAIPGVKVNKPEGAFYIFPEISAFFGKSINGQLIQNADDFCMYLLNEAHVAAVSGEPFGAPNCLRISYAASDEILKEAIERIAKACHQLR
jgi:aspartate aminotransferase